MENPLRCRSHNRSRFHPGKWSEEGGSPGIEFGYKGIDSAIEGILDRTAEGEIAGTGLARDISIPGGVHGNKPGDITAVAAQVGGIDRSPGGIELGDKGIGGAYSAKRGLEGAGSEGEVSGIGIPRDVSFSGGPIDGDTARGGIRAGAPQVGGVNQAPSRWGSAW